MLVTGDVGRVWGAPFGFSMLTVLEPSTTFEHAGLLVATTFWYLSLLPFGLSLDWVLDILGTLTCPLTLLWLVTCVLLRLYRARWHALSHSFESSLLCGSIISIGASARSLSLFWSFLIGWSPYLFWARWHASISPLVTFFPRHGLGTLACLPSLLLMSFFF